jgi:hypothetical protein
MMAAEVSGRANASSADYTLLPADSLSVSFQQFKSAAVAAARSHALDKPISASSASAAVPHGRTGEESDTKMTGVFAAAAAALVDSDDEANDVKRLASVQMADEAISRNQRVVGRSTTGKFPAAGSDDVIRIELPTGPSRGGPVGGPMDGSRSGKPSAESMLGADQAVLDVLGKFRSTTEVDLGVDLTDFLIEETRRQHQATTSLLTRSAIERSIVDSLLPTGSRRRGLSARDQSEVVLQRTLHRIAAAERKLQLDSSADAATLSAAPLASVLTSTTKRLEDEARREAFERHRERLQLIATSNAHSHLEPRKTSSEVLWHTALLRSRRIAHRNQELARAGVLGKTADGGDAKVEPTSQSPATGAETEADGSTATGSPGPALRPASAATSADRTSPRSASAKPSALRTPPSRRRPPATLAERARAVLQIETVDEAARSALQSRISAQDLLLQASVAEGKDIAAEIEALRKANNEFVRSELAYEATRNDPLYATAQFLQHKATARLVRLGDEVVDFSAAAGTEPVAARRIVRPASPGIARFARQLEQIAK